MKHSHNKINAEHITAEDDNPSETLHDDGTRYDFYFSFILIERFRSVFLVYGCVFFLSN